MKFRGKRALRAEFGKSFVVQARIITDMDNTIDIEGPVAGQAEASLIARLALGQDIKRALTDLPGYSAPLMKGTKE